MKKKLGRSNMKLKKRLPSPLKNTQPKEISFNKSMIKPKRPSNKLNPFLTKNLTKWKKKEQSILKKSTT